MSFDSNKSDMYQHVLREHEQWLERRQKKYIGSDIKEVNFQDHDFRYMEAGAALFQRHNLSGSDFFKSNLINANFIDCDLLTVNMLSVECSAARFDGAFIALADLSDANLRDTSFRDCIILHVQFHFSDIQGADFHGATLHAVEFDEAQLLGADFRGATISNVRVSSRESLKSAKIDSLSGFVFLDEERQQREERAEQIFDIDDKGTVSFSLPDGFNPLKVAKALMFVSKLVEGVRLCFTVDELSDQEIKSMVANLELWGAEQDKYATSIQSISKNSPIEVTFSTLAAVGALIVPLAGAAAMLYKTYADNKTKRRGQDLEHQQGMAELDLEREGLALEKWKAETEFQQKAQEIALMRAERQEQAKVPAVALNDFSSQNEELLAELSRHLRGDIDQLERRTELASSVVSRFQDHWLELVGAEWPPPEINGEPMPMPSDDYDDTPK